MPRVGVLALQGDVREHRDALVRAGADVVAVRRPNELDGLDGLVLPGGESTAIAYLLTTSGLKDALAQHLHDGLAVLATCAGMILLANEVLDGRDDQWSYATLDVTVRRNGYGRQIASFEAPIEVTGIGEVRGVFIRAPRVVRCGANVEVLATHDHGDGAAPVLVRDGSVLAASFHPELTDDARIHKLFLEGIAESAR